MRTGVVEAVETARAIYRAFGIRWALHRIHHLAKKRLGLYTSRPSGRAARLSDGSGEPAFVIDLARLSPTVSAAALESADRVARGEYQAYGDSWFPLPAGSGWHAHPLTGARYDDVAWFKVRHVNPGGGDIKDAWEPARFGWTYDLIRGYAATRDRRFATAFWARFEDFVRANPAFRGLHWSDGQETAMRAVAWMWAEAAFGAEATTDQRRMLATALFESAERIADATSYALSQRNNHAMWEAAALIAIGARFHGVSPDAGPWMRNGVRLFEACVLDQLRPDGWYGQHSFAYIRVALQSSVVIPISRAGIQLDPAVVDRLNAAAQLLVTVMEDATGDVPNHGANDGANPLPLSRAGYRDFRPAVTAFAVTFNREIAEPFTPDRETEAWLGGTVRMKGRRESLTVGASGWVSAHQGRARIFARAGAYRSRCGHLDPLHLDLWWNGRPVAIDAGTFRYAPPWNDALVVTAVHNTIDIPSIPIAHRGPGHLMIGVPEARVVSARQADDAIRMELANTSWRRHGIVHTRDISLTDTSCRVVDTVTGPSGLAATLHWLTPTGDDQPVIESDLPMLTNRVTGAEGSALGWWSLYYGAKVPAVSATTSFTIPASGRATLTSTFHFN